VTSFADAPPLDRPKVSVYIPCRDYGRFLAQAIESVVVQSYLAWELILIDDGSADETAAVVETWQARDPRRIRALRNSEPRGLAACSNLAFDLARGDYVMRLDPDDYLDENALLVLSNFLDVNPNVALVYPNYIYVDEDGRFLGIEQRKRVGLEAELLDLPAHGACTLIRKRVLKGVGGYSESHRAQDGYDLWLKILNRYRGQVANVATPLFYYRQHGRSLSRDAERIMAARRSIKREVVRRREGPIRPRTAAIVGAKNTYPLMPNVVLEPCDGRPLIDYTLDAAEASGAFDFIFVSSDDQQVVDYCRGRSRVTAGLRPAALSLPHVRLSQVLHHAVAELESTHGAFADIVVLLSVFTPLRRPEHIREAIDTLIAYDCDSVISVYEDRELHFTHGRHGLQPFNPGMLQHLQLEREALYVDNAAIHALWRDVVTEHDLYGRSVGHVTMSWEESLQSRSVLEHAIVEQLLLRQRQVSKT
jgi:CMP-N-acetylneuraminic acid synthetase